jgi:hypothetical protein
MEMRLWNAVDRRFRKSDFGGAIGLDLDQLPALPLLLGCDIGASQPLGQEQEGRCDMLQPESTRGIMNQFCRAANRYRGATP